MADLAKGMALALVLGLFARYEAVDNQHKVANGLPFAFVIQTISISNGELMSISLDSLGLMMDILLWTLFVNLADRISGIVRSQLHRTRRTIA